MGGWNVKLIWPRGNRLGPKYGGIYKDKGLNRRPRKKKKGYKTAKEEFSNLQERASLGACVSF